MKKFRFVSIIFFAMASILTCINSSGANKQSDETINRTIEIDKKFTGIKAEAAIEIIYTSNNSSPVAVISGPRQVVEGMTWKVSNNGVLSFKYPEIKNIRGKVTVKLNGTQLCNYESSSAAIIKVTTPVISTKNLNFSISSSGKIFMQKDVEVEKETLNISCSSSGEVKFMGAVKCNVANIAASSSSYVQIPYLSSSVINYSGSSMGIFESEKTVSSTFNIDISSGGSLTSKNSDIKTVNITGASGGEATFDKIIAKTANIEVSSGATVTMAGQCIDANLSSFSSGKINFKNMEIESKINRESSSGGRIILK